MQFIIISYALIMSYAHCCFPANEAFFACGGGTAVIETTQAPPTTVAETA